ncbi:glycoside hydrolase family 3 protein [Deinococcus arcticus]|uniref:glycoside hydrolase family 3 protein n=1 Tax=Deinococcus arcticus TaxID=2136176 RepID=UPI0013048672|nr:glycoside hydrolase family 3 N-terminal domain-containing protein [Deinococcus arcticus]
MAVAACRGVRRGLALALLSAGLGSASATWLAPAAAEARARALLPRLSLEEKIGQVTMAHMFRFTEGGRSAPLSGTAAQTFGTLKPGSVLNGGGDTPQPNTPRGWADFLSALDAVGRQSGPQNIPAVFGTDAVHGVNNVPAATLFPHNIGLGAAFSPALTREVAQATARDLRALNAAWTFAPVADVGRDPRWGRFYETFGEAPWLVADHVAAAVEGLQGEGVAATLKHFAGYGLAPLGLDRGNAELSARTLHETVLPPFQAGIRAGALSVMANSGSVNGVPAHASRSLLTEVLRGQLGFSGLLVSDWNDIDRLVGTYRTHADLVQATAASVNAGLDVYMVPNTVEAYAAALKEAVTTGLVSPARLDEATVRVLTFKARLGLLDGPLAGSGSVGDHRALAEKAAAASFTLLENPRGVLPLKAGRVLVTGPAQDSAAIQLGGWSVNWQGVGRGNVKDVPRVSTLAVALKASAPAGITVSALPEHKRPGLLAAAKQADTVVVALGEPPAAEWEANNPGLSLPAEQLALLRDLIGTGKPVVAVLMVGRPIVFPPELHAELAGLVMAYLPGTEGGAALANALYGRAGFPGRLPFTWPDTAAQAGLSADRPPEGAGKAPQPLYPLGHGLDYTTSAAREVTAAAGPGSVTLSAELINSGERAGTVTFVVRAALPASGALQAVARPVAALQAALKAGETRRVAVTIPNERLHTWVGDAFGAVRPELRPGTYAFTVDDSRAELTLP